MLKRKFSNISLLLLLVLIQVNSALSQDAEKMMKLRLAQNFEEANEWERAVVLYEELYKSEPANYIFLDGLRRSYTQLKEYDKAIGIIRQWFITHPRDISLMTILGGLYYNSGNEMIADSIWKVVLSIDPKNVQSYRIVANEMMQHRLYEQSIRTFIDGRTMIKSEVLFADELGTLYATLQQYTSATQEFLHLIIKNPDQLPIVQSRLSVIITKPEALVSVSETIKAEIKTSPDNIVLHRLYVWLLMEERHYDSALEHYRIIDRLANANGNELFNFAQQLNQEHASAAAAKTFKEIIDRYDKSILLPYARFGYARALEELNDEVDTYTSESQPTYQDAIQIYESIASAKDHPDLVIQSLFRIGIIKFEKLADLDGALTAFNKIKEFPNTMNILYDATIKNGEVQIARNDLSAARKEFERISKVPVVTSRDQAIFKLAELSYYEVQFDTSLSLLKGFNKNLNTDLTNDALQLQYFIQENMTSSLPALTEFAKADLQMRQRKFPESLRHFQNIVQQYPTTLLIDDAMMKIGELHLKLKQPNEAIAAFRLIIDSIQLSILKDKAQLRIAEIFENIIHNKALAITAYEKLLEQFPNSLYAEQARKRIRLLRGDAL